MARSRRAARCSATRGPIASTCRPATRFRPTVLPENGLTLRADIFNVFNTRRSVERNEFGQLDSGAINQDYQKAMSYMPPRSVRLGFDLVF